MSKLLKATALIHAGGAAIGRVLVKLADATHDTTADLHERVIHHHVRGTANKLLVLHTKQAQVVIAHKAEIARLKQDHDDALSAAAYALEEGVDIANDATDAAVVEINKQRVAALDVYNDLQFKLEAHQQANA